ncbi:response regulator transcription factor [Spirosoma sp. KNUC1025]|uniref:response regulator transcription factor n=1 Tax=Spirosoma sp. KNUC1025 TaxID=2894082 RepID=UPI00386E525A|nr:LytTR family transcriptional regulator DNA-binding domain-containing protein [Spirosoma sp. KNUC1025]
MSVIKPALQSPESIVYFLGANNYCWLYFRNGEKKLLAKPISYLEGQLPGFIRVHKTVLINPAYVKSLHQPPRQKMAGEIRLASGEVFPVSRRRWALVAEALQYYLVQNATDAVVERSAVATSSSAGLLPESARQSIFLITEDEQNAFMAKRAIERKWPAYQVHTLQRSSHLSDLLSQLTPENYPIFLVLDARTITLERLNTLQRLKANPKLGSIPVILLVTPTDQAVTDGYNYKANSVISMPEGYTLFTQTIERVCQFWLRTVALPGVTHPEEIESY